MIVPASPYRLRAWITPIDHGFQAFVISANAIKNTPPAVLVCPSQAEARAWVERLASSAAYEIEWLDASPRE